MVQHNAGVLYHDGILHNAGDPYPFWLKAAASVEASRQLRRPMDRIEAERLRWLRLRCLLYGYGGTADAADGAPGPPSHPPPEEEYAGPPEQIGPSGADRALHPPPGPPEQIEQYYEHRVTPPEHRSTGTSTSTSAQVYGRPSLLGPDWRHAPEEACLPRRRHAPGKKGTPLQPKPPPVGPPKSPPGAKGGHPEAPQVGELKAVCYPSGRQIREPPAQPWAEGEGGMMRPTERAIAAGWEVRDPPGPQRSVGPESAGGPGAVDYEAQGPEDMDYEEEREERQEQGSQEQAQIQKEATRVPPPSVLRQDEEAPDEAYASEDSTKGGSRGATSSGSSKKSESRAIRERAPTRWEKNQKRMFENRQKEFEDARGETLTIPGKDEEGRPTKLVLRAPKYRVGDGGVMYGPDGAMVLDEEGKPLHGM